MHQNTKMCTIHTIVYACWHERCTDVDFCTFYLSRAYAIGRSWRLDHPHLRALAELCVEESQERMIANVSDCDECLAETEMADLVPDQGPN